MIFIALILMATGLVGGILGFKLFKILLPLLGLVGGSAVGFVGFQSIFGTGAVSTTVAVFVAIAVGLVFALLSFMYFRIAVVAYVALLGASLLSYLGVALGLSENGFVLGLLAVSGIVLGIIVASHDTFSGRLVIILTSFAGVSLILAGIFLVAGNVTMDQLNEQGVIASVVKVVDQSFLWLFVWLAGGLIMAQVQKALLLRTMLDNHFQFEVRETSNN